MVEISEKLAGPFPPVFRDPSELGATIIPRRAQGQLDTMVDFIAANYELVKASRWADAPAQLYVTGGWPIEATESQIMSFARHIRTCQSPIGVFDDESNAREQDVEKYAATPDDWPDFWVSRTDRSRATCYCSLINVPLVISSCRDAGIPLPSRWRLAWWWKNAPGTPIPDEQVVPAPDLDEVLGELQRLTGITLPREVVWGCQYVNHEHWDLTTVYGKLDYARD